MLDYNYKHCWWSQANTNFASFNYDEYYLMDMMVGYNLEYSLEVTESARHVREKRRKSFSIGDREQVQSLFHLIRVFV